MKLKLAATVFALTWVGSAMAADPVIYDPAPVPAPDPVRLGYDWNGAYAGLHLGYGWGRGAYELTGGPDESGSFGIDGPFGGVTLGADMQNGPWVFGVIGDIAATGIRGSTTVDFDDDVVDARILWMGSLRGRAGYAFDNVLPYVTGGLALASSRITVSGNLNVTDTQTHVGWTIGTGVEVGMTDNISTALEYRYTDLGSTTYDIGATFETVGSGHLHTIGAVVNWRF